jgi:hypothetical protein
VPARFAPIPQLLGGPPCSQRYRQWAKAAPGKGGNASTQDGTFEAAVSTRDSLTDPCARELPKHSFFLSEPVRPINAAAALRGSSLAPPAVGKFRQGSVANPANRSVESDRVRRFWQISAIGTDLDYPFPSVRMFEAAGKKGDFKCPVSRNSLALWSRSPQRS